MKRCPFPDEGEHVVEIRPVYEAEDFGDAFSPEARERELGHTARVSVEASSWPGDR